MIQGTVDDKHEVATEPLPCDEVFCISQNRTVTDDDTLRAASGTCGVEDVGTTRGQITTCQTGSYLLKQRFWGVALQGRSHRTCQMDSEVGDEEINSLRTAEHHHLPLRQGGSTRLYPLVQRGITDRLTITDDSGAIGCLFGMLP